METIPMIEICAKDKCIGCEVCVNACPCNCISFNQDEEGFFYPAIDQSKCTDCKRCSKVCPANSQVTLHKVQKKVFAAWALDDNIRQSSSSGGLYSVFANYCISQGGVVNGVYFNDEKFAVHELFEDAEKMKICRGSKYVQSRPGNIYREVKKSLDEGKMVFFTSTPCQVAALYNFLGRDYENLYTCDFICHGVPSPQYFKDCLNKITSNAENISQITFRDLSGWGGYGISVCGDGKFFNEHVINHSYIKLFLACSNFRNACYNCSFARNERVADITIGDFWGLGKYMPFLHDTGKGVSLLIVNSKKGKKLLTEVKGQLFLAQRSFREAARDNHQLYRRAVRPANRGEFYRDVKNLSDVELINKYCRKVSCCQRLFSLPGRVFRKILRLTFRCLVLMYNKSFAKNQ